MSVMDNKTIIIQFHARVRYAAFLLGAYCVVDNFGNAIKYFEHMNQDALTAYK